MGWGHTQTLFYIVHLLTPQKKKVHWLYWTTSQLPATGVFCMNNTHLYAHLIRTLACMRLAEYHRILHFFSSPITAWHATPSEFIGSRLRKEWISRFITERSQININEEKEHLELLHATQGIQLLYKDDRQYPALLQNIAQPPFLLYARGDISLLQYNKTISIVGARKATSYGKSIVKESVQELVHAGFTTISGLAYGIDQDVHQETLNNNGRTIAVLGSSILEDEIYPRRNAELARKIISNNGVLISEYPPHSQIYASHFPERNRIIAGLSETTLVVEAGLKSGSLITARFALEQGRNVFAVPGSLYSSQSVGTNTLISRGATPWLGCHSFFDTLELESITGVSSSVPHIQLSSEEKLLTSYFSVAATIDDAIDSNIDIPAHTIIQLVTGLLLKGILRDIGSGHYLSTL